MAGTFSLNTTSIPTLRQLIVALPDGTLYDHLAQMSGGVVVKANPIHQAVLRTVKLNGVSVLTEV